jgi:hypothetical protein
MVVQLLNPKYDGTANTDKYVNAHYFSDRAPSSSLRLAQASLNGTMHWVTMPEFFNALLHIPENFDQLLSYHYINCATEEYTITGKNGKQLLVGIHGGGIYTNPDRIAEDWKNFEITSSIAEWRSGPKDNPTIDPERWYTNKKLGQLTDEEIKALQNERLPDNRIIPFIQYAEFLKNGAPKGILNYAVVIPLEDVQKSHKDGAFIYFRGDDFERYKNDPLIAFRVGGLEPLEELAEIIHTEKYGHLAVSTKNYVCNQPFIEGKGEIIYVDVNHDGIVTLDEGGLSFVPGILAYSFEDKTPKQKAFQDLPPIIQRQIIIENATIMEFSDKRRANIKNFDNLFTMSDPVDQKNLVHEYLKRKEEDAIYAILSQEKYQEELQADNPGNVLLDLLMQLIGSEGDNLKLPSEELKNAQHKSEEELRSQARKFASNIYPKSMEKFDEHVQFDFERLEEFYATEKSKRRALDDFKDELTASYEYARRQSGITQYLIHIAATKGFEEAIKPTTLHQAIKLFYDTPDDYIGYMEHGMSSSNAAIAKQMKKMKRPEQVDPETEAFRDVFRLVCTLQDSRTNLEAEVQKALAIKRAKEIWLEYTPSKV